MGQISALIGGIGLVTSLIGRKGQEQAQQQAIDLRLKQQESANVERSIKRGRRLNEVMAAQVAREGASGLSLSSPSFFAVGRNSFNQFAEDENADALNLSFDKMSAMNQEASIKRQRLYGSLGDIFNAAGTAFNANIFAKAPTPPVIAKTLQPQPQPQPQQPHAQNQSVLSEIFKGSPIQDFIL